MPFEKYKKMLKKISVFCCLFLLFQNTKAQVKDSVNDGVKYQIYQLSNGEIYTYKKPKFLGMIANIPKDVVGTVHKMGENSNLIALGSSLVATVALLPTDQYLLERSREIGENLGMEEVARYKNFGPLNNIPPNLTSGIYLIGNGTTPLLLSMGFATYGLIKHDYRSLNTASGLVESLAVSGVFSQTIKRITGRQSPAPAIMDGNPGGNWSPFPSFKGYAANTPNYDAMPSGHMMTATSALYVIMGNYPEKKWIRPVGFGLIGLLGFQMVQSEVHWVSDYPIAMVMGYIIGKNIANSKIKKNSLHVGEVKKYHFNLDASRRYGYNLVGASLTF